MALQSRGVKSIAIVKFVHLLLRYQGIRDKISLQEVQCVRQVVLTFGTNPANGGFFPPFGGLEPTAFVQACFGMVMCLDHVI